MNNRKKILLLLIGICICFLLFYIVQIYAKYFNQNEIENFPIYYIGGSQTLPPPLPPEEEEELLNQLRPKHDISVSEVKDIVDNLVSEDYVNNLANSLPHCERKLSHSPQATLPLQPTESLAPPRADSEGENTTHISIQPTTGMPTRIPIGCS